jgi:HAD superfamily hydrolase (TIGR01509 family)
MPARLDAVLFDWGDTLFRFAFNEHLLEAGWEAGLAAIGRHGLPGHEESAARFRERYVPLLWEPGSLEEIEYPGMIREALGGFGVEVSAEELDRFLEAEHDAWQSARQMGSSTHALLDSLRERGLKLGLVSNAFDPVWLLERDLERMGLAERLDVAVFSSSIGKRKPHPAIFEAALEPLGVDPERSLFVGDSRVADVHGAKTLGMATVQALWFRADENTEPPEPDYEAFTQMDVLNVVRRVLGET